MWNSLHGILAVFISKLSLPLTGVTGGCLGAQEELSKEDFLVNTENSFCLFLLLLFRVVRR